MNSPILIPFVCGAGATQPGSEHGPLYCFDHHLASRLDVSWQFDPYQHWLQPYGEAAHAALPVRGSKERHEIVQWHNAKLAHNVATALHHGHRAVTIGGDHSLAAGSMAGAKRALGADGKCGIVWIDAHPDLHSFASSTSKSLHGMPMATMLGLDDTLILPDHAYPIARPDDVVYIGLRDIDDPEHVNAAALGITMLHLETLRQQDLSAFISREISALQKRCDHIFLSIDLDSFAEHIAPAVSSPVPSGFLVDEILPHLVDLVRSHSVPLIDLVEFNPTLPGAAETYDLMIEILSALLKKSA